MVIVLELDYNDFTNTQLIVAYEEYLHRVIEEYECDATAAINHIFYLAEKYHEDDLT